MNPMMIPELTEKKIKLLSAMCVRENIGEEYFPLFRVADKHKVELSFAQRRLWFLYEYSESNPFYNEPIVLDLRGNLNKEALLYALNSLLQRHEIMRTNIVAENGKPVQRVVNRKEFPLESLDLCGREPERSRKEIADICVRLVNTQFDFSSDSLCLSVLVKHSQEQHTLIFLMHHIISDAWSMGVFVEEIFSFYKSYQQRQEHQLPPLPLQYSDFSLWERQVLSGSYLKRLANFWQKELGGIPHRISLPRDRARVNAPTYKGERLYFSLSPELTEEVNRFNRSMEEGITQFMTLLAVYYLVLNYLGGDQDLVVGTDVANRPNAEIEKLIGFFVNQLVLRVQLDEDMSFQDLLLSVKETCNAAYSHQTYPFDRLVDLLNEKREIGISPLFQAKFVLQNAPLPGLDMGNLKIKPVPFHGGTAKFELLLDITLVGSNLEGWLEYSEDFFDKATAQRILRIYQQLLPLAIRNPNLSLSHLKQEQVKKERAERSEKRATRKKVSVSFNR